MRADELRKALEGVPLREVKVDVETERGRYVAIVTSPDFEGMPHGQRQSLVWQRLHEVFRLEQLVAVDFVFTYSPAEQERTRIAAG